MLIAILSLAALVGHQICSVYLLTYMSANGDV